ERDRRNQPERRIERRDIRNWDRNWNVCLLILDINDRQNLALRVKTARNALNVGRRVHVDAERLLRLTHFDLRSPVRDAASRLRTWIHVKDVANFVREGSDISEIFPFLNRYAIRRDRDVDEDARDDQRDDAEKSVLQQDEGHPSLGWHGGKWKPTEVDVVH